MIKKVLSLALAVFLLAAANAQSGPARLIIRGDDMGFAHAGNEALIKSHKDGIEQSIEVLVPSPWFPEAVKLLAKEPNADVGVHLALTSEWETVKWRPLTHCPSLTDSSGYFYPMLYPNTNYPGRALKQHAWKISEIENELRAQIELAKKMIPRVSHVSAHMGCDMMDKEVTSLVKRLAQEYKIDIDPRDYQVRSIGYQGPAVTAAEKLKSFIAMLDSLKPGNTYLFVDHPAFDGPEMRAIYHIGYENVAADRQGVLETFTSPAVLNAIRRNNIKLISYADLKK
jgi:predicted glycoside hydrolase/deacetylase ChbG (UPF0249 family)